MNIKDILNDALPIISTFAPTIAAAIGGPVGGYVLPLLANAFNVHSADLSKLSQAIKNDPDVKNKMEGLEIDHRDFINNLINNPTNLSSAKINFEVDFK